MTLDQPPYDPDYDGPPTIGRQPAANNEAERAVLGALILNPKLADEISAELEPADFYRPQHETIYTAALHIAQHTTGDVQLDAISLAEHLAKTGQLTKVGGGAYLYDLTSAVPLTGNAGYYAQLVRDAARARTFQQLGTKLIDIGNRAAPGDLGQAFDTAYAALDEAAARVGPTTPDHSHNTTGLHDLTWILTGQPPTQDPPAYCHRTDGHALFYAGKVNGIFGDPESGKTWLAQAAIVEALNAGDTAAMIDVDHNGPDHTAARLLLLGARLEHLADPNRFRYYEPEEGDQLRSAIAELTAWRPAVVLIDSLGEVFPLLGVKTNDGDEITMAMRQICTPPATAGSCVITVDHLPKSTEARSTGFAIGSIAKKRMTRGAYIRAEARVQPAPGQIGRITLRIEKDTIGELRKVTPGGYAGTFTLDSSRPNLTTWSIGREDSPITDTGAFRPTDRMEAVSRYVEQNDQCTFRDIKESVAGKDTTLRTAINLLVSEGFMTTLAGPKNSKLHHAISLYREAEDDHL